LAQYHVFPEPRAGRKVAIQIALSALLALIVVNAYLGLRNLNRVREGSSQSLDAALLQRDIDSVMLDLSEIESGQRGYLLTNDQSYLEPYAAAKTRLESDMETLRTKLAGHPARERTLLDEVKAIGQSKVEEAEKTIDLRQRGFRKRAFDMMDASLGKQYMDQSRARLEALSAAATSSFATTERATAASVLQARTTMVLANLALLALTAIVFVSFRWYTGKLERDVAQRTAALRDANGKLEGVTSTISQKVRELLGGLQGSAEALLQGYGDFLPRQAQQHAEYIQGAAGETNQLIDELIEDTRLHNVA
jgi:CHASE3 domain sensor protein